VSKEAQIIGILFHGTTYILILTKNGLGYLLADSFTNSSGHPDLNFSGSTNLFSTNPYQPVHFQLIRINLFIFN
jgi:hypothetical protein